MRQDYSASHFFFWGEKNALLHRAGREGKKQEVWDNECFASVCIFCHKSLGACVPLLPPRPQPLEAPAHIIR